MHRVGLPGSRPGGLAGAFGARTIVFGFGITEILLVAVLLTLFFGAKKLPDLARGLGAGIRNFKGELNAPPDEGAENEEDSEPRRLN